VTNSIPAPGKGELANDPREETPETETGARKCPECGEGFLKPANYRVHFLDGDHSPPWQDERLLRRMYREEGLSTTEIAEELDCSSSNISKWMQRHGIETDRAERISKNRPRVVDATPEKLTDSVWLEEKYIEQEKSCREIADEIGCSHSAVRGWLGEHGIPIRSKAECHKLIAEKMVDERTPVELQDEGHLRGLYIDEDLTIEEIAQQIGCANSTVWVWLNRHSIEIGTGWSIYGEDHWAFKHGERSYGVGWGVEKKKAVRERDNKRCRVCGMAQKEHLSEYGRRLSVHHIIPARDFDGEGSECNKMSNLVTLCMGCHHEWEGIPLTPDVGGDDA